jgi:hypothetical protein
VHNDSTKEDYPTFQVKFSILKWLTLQFQLQNMITHKQYFSVQVLKFLSSSNQYTEFSLSFASDKMHYCTWLIKLQTLHVPLL